jgi:hypothetical protein
MSSATAGPSNTHYTRVISGPVPGTLDPDQPYRLLRSPGSRLLFASYDPLAAIGGREHSAPNGIDASGSGGLYRAKRIVVEISPSGESTWRFIPKARMDLGVDDEGTWPQVVNLCG